MSDEKWNFKDEEEIDGLFYIQNNSTKEVLEAVEATGEVVLEDLVKGYAQQLWFTDISYDQDTKDYFMLQNYNDYKNDYDNEFVLTAQNSTEIKLKVQGNISLSWIVN